MQQQVSGVCIIVFGSATCRIDAIYNVLVVGRDNGMIYNVCSLYWSYVNKGRLHALFMFPTDANLFHITQK